MITARGTWLVVDRCRPRNRVIEVAPDGRELWSFDHAPRLNVAAPLADGRVLAFIDRTMVYLDRSGHSEKVLTLPGTEPVEALGLLGTLVAAGSDDGLDIIDLSGRHLANWPAGQLGVRTVTDVAMLADGGLLLTDSWQSCVVEVDARGAVRRRFGRRHAPGGRGPLAGCRSACRTADGRTLVADTFNRRVVIFDLHGQVAGTLAPADGTGLTAPTFVRPIARDAFVVVDTGSCRVLNMRADGQIRGQIGSCPPSQPLLAFPRCATVTPAGSVLVTDSFHHRIVELDRTGGGTWELGAASASDPGLCIPRSACRQTDGSTVVADGINGRVLVADRAARVTREVTSVRTRQGRSVLADPHHAEMVGTNLLITDSGTNAVWLIDEDDRVVRRWGGQDLPWFDDPHCAHLLPDGTLLVADSGHGRICLCPPGDTAGPTELELRDDTGAPVTLDYPRFVLPLAGNGLAVVDTDASRVLLTRPDGTVRSVAGPLVDTGAAADVSTELRTPRWAAMDRNGHLLVTDYWNSRVAVLGPSSASAD